MSEDGRGLSFRFGSGADEPGRSSAGQERTFAFTEDFKNDSA